MPGQGVRFGPATHPLSRSSRALCTPGAALRSRRTGVAGSRYGMRRDRRVPSACFGWLTVPAVLRSRWCLSASRAAGTPAELSSPKKLVAHDQLGGLGFPRPKSGGLRGVLRIPAGGGRARRRQPCVLVRLPHRSRKRLGESPEAGAHLVRLALDAGQRSGNAVRGRGGPTVLLFEPWPGPSHCTISCANGCVCSRAVCCGICCASRPEVPEFSQVTSGVRAWPGV